jgi:putative membrane protein
MTEKMQKSNRHFTLLLSVMIVTMCISAYKPRYQMLWFAYSVWNFAGLAVLFATRKSFIFTPLAYFLIWIYGTVMMVGAHFTYEREPVFQWLQVTFDLSRNHYDRFAHFLQGFTPAIITREILIRKGVVAGEKWLVFITVSICLAISAGNELVEWWYALLMGKKGVFSLGMQGDFWDTQWDMFLAFIGAMAAMALKNIHDRQITTTSITAPSVK